MWGDSFIRHPAVFGDGIGHLNPGSGSGYVEKPSCKDPDTQSSTENLPVHLQDCDKSQFQVTKFCATFSQIVGTTRSRSHSKIMGYYHFSFA